MVDMDNFFHIQISSDRLSSVVSLKSDAPANCEINVSELKQWIIDQGVVFGIKEDVLQAISQDIYSQDYPVVIAEGVKPIKGTDGFLIDQTKTDRTEDANRNKNFNLRNVMSIPSVKKGQLLARIVPPTRGVPGKNVFGKSVPASDGKPIKFLPGKNVLFHLDSVFSTVDGQLSILPKSINVFPVFEVNGDLDLKTGNIDFIGNVLIKGNVPSGYTIKAGGDIKVVGLVEGAELIAGGSISISGGIAAGARGYVQANVNLYCNYLNQATCKVGQDIFVDSSILHSHIECGGNIVSSRGHIIGGEIRALGNVEANDIGNYHYMQTNIRIGITDKSVEREVQLQTKLKEIEQSIKKLQELASHIKKRSAKAGRLSQQDRLLLQKQKVTIKPLEQQFVHLENELLEIKKVREESRQAFLKASKTIFPNVHIHFGKYSKSVQHQMQAVKIFLEQSEVVSVPL